MQLLLLFPLLSIVILLIGEAASLEDLPPPTLPIDRLSLQVGLQYRNIGILVFNIIGICIDGIPTRSPLRWKWGQMQSSVFPEQSERRGADFSWKEKTLPNAASPVPDESNLCVNNRHRVKNVERITYWKRTLENVSST